MKCWSFYGQRLWHIKKIRKKMRSGLKKHYSSWLSSGLFFKKSIILTHSDEVITTDCSWVFFWDSRPFNLHPGKWFEGYSVKSTLFFSGWQKHLRFSRVATWEKAGFHKVNQKKTNGCYLIITNRYIIYLKYRVALFQKLDLWI